MVVIQFRTPGHLGFRARVPKTFERAENGFEGVMAVLGERERGASAVEFALIASLLFMVLFGIIQFGIAYNRIQGLQAGAREGGRLGALPDTTRADIITRVKDSVSIVNDSSLAVPCPGGLAIERACIDVYSLSSTGTQ